MKAQINIFPINQINKNGHLYTSDCFKEVVKEQRKMFITFDKDSIDYIDNKNDIILENVVGQIENIKIENDNVVGDVEFINNKNLENLIKHFSDGLNTDFVLVPKGVGHIKNDGTVYNYNPISFNIIPKADDSFERV
jgi:hypothetical protein